MPDTLLIVDDNPVDRKILEGVLKKEEYNLVVAGDGEAALTAVEQQQPDLILLDVMMPGLSGYEVCDRLKAHAETAEIPVLFLSSLAEAKDKVKGLNAGGLDYIAKPFDTGEVLARVRAHLELIHLNRDLQRANRELETRQNQMEKDLEAAAVIQRTLLPRRKASISHIDMAWKFLPCEAVGGDLLNVLRLDEDHWAVYMIDVTGHGVPAAMVSVSVSHLLDPNNGQLVKTAIHEPPYYRLASPAEVITGLDEAYSPGRLDKLFSISYLVLNVRTGKLQYSNAAHPYPLLVRAAGETELLRIGGTMVGMGGVMTFEEGTVALKSGDKLFLYTDGITEHRNEEKLFFGEQRLYDEIAGVRTRPVEEIVERVMDAVLTFSRREPQDDVSLLGFEYRGE